MIKKLNEGIETGQIVNDIQDCEYFIHILQKRLDEINNLNEQIRTTRRAVDIDSVVTKANKYSTEMAIAAGRAMRQANLLQKELEDIVDKTDGGSEGIVFDESKSRTRKRSIKESYEGSHTFGYIEPDGEFYQDVFGEFTVEEYYDEERDEMLGWTWYCSDDFEPTEPYFSTAKEAYEDATYVLTPDDGSELVIDEY